MTPTNEEIPGDKNSASKWTSGDSTPSANEAPASADLLSTPPPRNKIVTPMKNADAIKIAINETKLPAIDPIV